MVPLFTHTTPVALRWVRLMFTHGQSASSSPPIPMILKEMKFRNNCSPQSFSRLLLIAFSATSLNMTVLQQSKAETAWAPIVTENIPLNAIKNDAKSDLGFSIETPLYICRHQANIGTFFPKKNKCRLAIGAKTKLVEARYVEILTSTWYAWVDYENNEIPLNAVQITGTAKDRYICRAFVGGSYLFGYLAPVTGRCVVAVDNKVVSPGKNISILTSR